MDEMEYILQRYSLMESNGTEMYFDADEIVDLLDHFEDTDDFEHYEKVLELGQKLHPENQDIKIRMCRALVYREEYDEALRTIERIGDPDDLELNLLKMECCCALNRFDEVRAFVDEMQAENCEELEDIFEYLAPVMNELKRFDEAGRLLQRGMALFPDNLILKEEYCYYLEMQGQPQQAMSICSELIDADPYSPDYWYMQGRLCLLQGEYDKAVDAFDFALACDDSDVEIKVMKAYCLFMNEHYDKAIDVYLELLSDGHASRNIQPYLAECYMKSEHYEQAYAIFKELLEDIDIAQGLALYKSYIRCCLETGRENEANEILPEIAARFPEDLLLLTLQAFVHLATGEQEEAVEITVHILDMVYQASLQGNRMPEMMRNMRALGQNVKQLMEEIHRLIEPQVKKSYNPVHRAMNSLIEGDMKRFCKRYAKCPPEMIAGYVRRIFSLVEKGIYDDPRSKNGFLQAREIHPRPAECVASHRLSSSYLTNGYHNN